MTADALGQLIVLTCKQALGPLRADLASLEAQALALRQALQERAAALDAQAAEVAALRERLAVLETRAPVPGPPGRDGLDGLGLDDLSAEFDGERTLTLRLTAGTVTKHIPLRLPIPRYCGVWDGRDYEVGDVVTWEGSAFHCQQATASRPSERAEAWRLMVKRGRDLHRREPERPAPAPQVGVS